MTITVANFILKYLRPALASVTDFPDATLGYWIDAALLDISRSFPRKTYALWSCSAGVNAYAYDDSTTDAIGSTIIRVLNCQYPWVSVANNGISLVYKSHLEDNFFGGNYYDPDNDFGMIYVGPAVAAATKVYADCHIIWQVNATPAIINPSGHYELIRLFCIWQAYLHQMGAVSSTIAPDSSLVNSLALEAWRAERSYRAAYGALDQAKATSGVATGWPLDKWDKRGVG